MTATIFLTYLVTVSAPSILHVDYWQR